MLTIVRTAPHLLKVWELLPTKAPGPSLARPYCCYARTVIFYVRPWTVRPWHHIWRDWKGCLRADKPGCYLERWDEIEHTLTWDSKVEYEGEIYVCGGGQVVWQHRRWWMRHWARREWEGEE